MWVYAYAENEANKITYQAKALLSIMEGFSSVVIESCQLMVGECLIHIQCWHHQLFDCEASCHGTSLKVQDGGWLFSTEVPDV